MYISRILGLSSLRLNDLIDWYLLKLRSFSPLAASLMMTWFAFATLLGPSMIYSSGGKYWLRVSLNSYCSALILKCTVTIGVKYSIRFRDICLMAS